ncbi:MAG: NUDIX domain-containing protein [Mycobacterium sp.]|nr:NUDIX domain-containing protein [Mycobacterium sp.]
MTFSVTTVFFLALLALLLVVLALWAYSVAHRLDRLNLRSDQSWQALEAALARRAVVARTVAAALAASSEELDEVQAARRLSALADRAERAERSDRETVENQLAAALSQVDIAALRPQLVAELSDAEARVLLARRFHNDAVRDTRALRLRPAVRILHLGGRAPVPPYFEIAERATPAAALGLAVHSTRISARIVLLDEQDRVLLMRGHDPVTPTEPFWFTVGGGVEPGESLRSAAVRELYEETGHHADPGALRGPLWRRVAVFAFAGDLVRSEELFFVLRVPAFEPAPMALKGRERQTITGTRWCSAADIADLESRGEPVYPYHLDSLLAEAVQAVSAPTEPEVRSIR